MEILQQFKLNDKQINQFEQYANLLIQWNEKFNLTSIVDKQEIYIKHFADCLSLTTSILEGCLLDIGSGAGFPGIVLKIYFPNLKVCLLEPNNKKVSFLKEVIKQLDLKDIEVVNQRAEEFIETNRERYDYVTARAVSQLNILLELALPFLKVGGHFLAMKGPKANEELIESQKALQVLNGQLVKQTELKIEDNTRVILDIVKKDITNNKYPRNYSQIKKKPL